MFKLQIERTFWKISIICRRLLNSVQHNTRYLRDTYSFDHSEYFCSHFFEVIKTLVCGVALKAYFSHYIWYFNCLV